MVTLIYIITLLQSGDVKPLVLRSEWVEKHEICPDMSIGLRYNCKTTNNRGAWCWHCREMPQCCQMTEVFERG